LGFAGGMNRLIAGFWLIGGISALAGQPPSPTASPGDRFDVATIRQNKSGDRGGGIRRQPGGRLIATNVTLRTLITFAYQINGYQLTGGPGWADNDTFDILAKMEGNPEWGAPGMGEPDPAQRAMQSLLVERFKLRTHRELRDMDVYELVMVKAGVPGPALKPSTSDCQTLAEQTRKGKVQPPPGPPPAKGLVACSAVGSAGMIRFDGYGMPQVANILIGQAGRVVVDRTGLAGNWQFVLTFTPEQRGPLPAGADLPPTDPNAPSFFTALREQLGLKLESTRTPVEVIVLDADEHPED